MNWRVIWMVILLFVGLGANAFAVLTEEVELPDAKALAQSRDEDPLIDMKFNSTSREQNFQRMGFAEDEVKKIMQKVVSLEERHQVRTDPANNRVRMCIEQADDQDAINVAFCGTESTLPVRYAAMAYLVVLKGDERRVVEFDEISAFKRQEWFSTSPVASVYNKAELTRDREPDAVRMALAAVLGKDEELLINQQAPYGRGLFNAWSWAKANDNHPGLHQRVLDYVATFQLVMEVAFTEDGLCGGIEEDE